MAKEAAPPEMSFWEAIADSITGSRRVTPETMALPEYTGMPELNRFSLPSFRSALGTVITSPEETVKVLLSNFPELRVRQDSKGNYILRSSINNREYAIPPGFSVGDIPRALAGLASVVPAGLATTIPRAAAVAAGNQAAFEASQALTGGSFDPDDVAIAGTIGAAFPALGAGAKAAIGAARKVLRRSTPQQSFQAGGVTRASNAIAASKGAGKGAADPLLLRTLAAEANRTPFTAKANKGMADPSQAFTDVERMAKEYGYEGLMNPQQGTAILYRPTPVQPFKQGGLAAIKRSC